MKELQDLEPDDSRFWPTIRRLMAQVTSVVYEQQFMLFPLMQKTCSNEELLTLGGRAQDSAKVAPARPHPDAVHHLQHSRGARFGSPSGARCARRR
jgi:hypothetical protein